MNEEKSSKTAVFIMPRTSNSWEGAEALWITVAGWATAAKRLYGRSVVITKDRIAQPEEVWNYPLLKEKKTKIRKRRYFLIPPFIKTVINDLITWRNLKNWEILEDLSFENRKPSFIWEKHDLFSGPGRSLANKYKVPLISYVHAPVVWEASKWGVKRFVWGKWLEKIESDNLKNADLVAVVSKEVKEKVMEMGVSEEKILISPMAVEPQLFFDQENIINDEFNLKNKFVIGWTGSFRKFHGLDHVIKAFKKVSEKYPESVLMLVGDGAERNTSEVLVRELGISEKVIFTGRRKFLEIPKYVSQFDIAVVSARNAEGFHYSPLKLREYMAAGKAVLAPNAGEIPETFRDDVNLKLFTAGDIESLEKGMLYLIESEDKRKEIAQNGKNKIIESSTWDIELKKALEYLKN